MTSAADIVARYGDAAGWDAAKRLALVCEFLDTDPEVFGDGVNGLDGFLVSKLPDGVLDKMCAEMVGAPAPAPEGLAKPKYVRLDPYSLSNDPPRCPICGTSPPCEMDCR